MAIDPVSLSGLMQPLSGDSATQSAATSGAGFSRILDQLVGSATHSHESAEAAVRDLALGQTDNFHGVMLQMAQADLSFRLILEIRNRLTDAYQEIMKMTV
jgi:flagellar hook-basal body complex protein FliE